MEQDGAFRTGEGEPHEVTPVLKIDQSVQELYQEHARPLWAFFYSRCCDSERAYDAVQEAFLRFISHKGVPVRDARAWLLQVGLNWLRDVARKKSSSCQLMPAMDFLPGDARDSEFTLRNNERQAEIRDALKQLAEDDRKVLVMKYALDWSTAKIASAMNSNAAAVDMRLTRARRRLAEILVEKGYEP
jgi:RNA polymerase sigma factor (sigma-70 family)